MRLTMIHLSKHLPKGICSLHQPALAAPGKRSPYNCNIHSQISLALSQWYVSCLCPKNMDDILSGFKLLIVLFPVFRGGRKDQILFLKFSKDRWADNRGEFTYGGSANQPVILSGLVQFLRCLSVIASFSLTAYFFDAALDAFLNKVNNCSWHTNKILETMDISLY